MRLRLALVSALLVTGLAAHGARAQISDGVVKIGVLNDQTGLYADLGGPGSVVAARMAVDTHVFRVGNRTGLAPGKTPLEVELGLERVIPAEFMLHAHHWLILHGRYTCLARQPRCAVCLINDLCRWPEKTI